VEAGARVVSQECFPLAPSSSTARMAEQSDSSCEDRCRTTAGCVMFTIRAFTAADGSTASTCCLKTRIGTAMATSGVVAYIPVLKGTCNSPSALLFWAQLPAHVVSMALVARVLTSCDYMYSNHAAVTPL
jgi:hypothetical protein